MAATGNEYNSDNEPSLDEQASLSSIGVKNNE